VTPFEFYETDQLVPVGPALVTRFRWRADRRARRRNEERLAPTYRWGVVRNLGRWEVVAFQNVARPRDEVWENVPPERRHA
jgi:hypothetical protein